MKLVEVTSRKLAKEFIKVAHFVYADDEHWVCPLDNMINNIFNPKKNVFYTHGDAIRWMLYDDQNKAIGRVAAFINEKKAFNFNQPTGGMGFFECIDDQDAAFMLFDKCKEWLVEKGMKAMDGPINFGENDNFWGLLVDGFTHPSFGMNYHRPYYKNFFEAYGFEPYFNQVTNHLNLTVPFPERFWKIADWVRRKPAYTFQHLEIKKIDKYLKDLKEIYDNAWQFHENFTPVELDNLYKSFKEAKSIIVEEFTWFVYNEGKPIAFLVMFPDANQLLKPFKGKLHLLNKIKFFINTKRNKMTRTRITVMGVIPEFQGKGVESGIFWHMNEVMKHKPQYTEIEMSWVGDFNPKMQAIHEAVGGRFGKKHITYRMHFDNSSVKKRSTIIPMNTKEQVTQIEE